MIICTPYIIKKLFVENYCKYSLHLMWVKYILIKYCPLSQQLSKHSAVDTKCIVFSVTLIHIISNFICLFSQVNGNFYSQWFLINCFFPLCSGFLLSWAQLMMGDISLAKFIILYFGTAVQIMQSVVFFIYIILSSVYNAYLLLQSYRYVFNMQSFYIIEVHCILKELYVRIYIY